jgi:hypothetical protein
MNKHELFTTALCSLFAAFGVLVMFNGGVDGLTAKVVADPVSFRNWVTINEQQVLSGATLQPYIHTFVQVPTKIPFIDRETFLGGRGKLIRYWGYCLPPASENDPDNLRQTSGFPGKIFLSEAERAWRKERDERLNRVTPFNPPTDFSHTEPVQNVIRHQIDIFKPGMTCYVMSAGALAVGIDEDSDGLNTQLEKEDMTDPTNPDTDGDGITDGIEVIIGKTMPLTRDTDGDGLLDGIEDANHNGYLDYGETDPRERDTDKDGLCDGLCSEYVTKRYCGDNVGRDCVDIPYGQQMGEDRNYNGKVDTGESSPINRDSNSNGIWDQEEFYRCLLDGNGNC